VGKLPPHLRGAMGRSSVASSAAVGGDGEAGASAATAPEELDYIQEMKSIQFRMVRMDHSVHTYVATLIFLSRDLRPPMLVPPREGATTLLDRGNCVWAWLRTAPRVRPLTGVCMSLSCRYSKDIRGSASACIKRDRIRRITREMASLSTSLPLTFTSSM
jgi:hypothetical protein